MKRFIILLLVFLMVFGFTLSANASDPELAESGKNVVTIGDWVLEKIENGTRWEMDEYVGPGGEVIVPWQVSDIMVVSLGDHCFANNTNVTSVITTSPPWRIGEYCFIDCTSLEKVVLNFMLDTIGVGAFSGTSSLKDINLEDSIVTEIKSYTFLNSGIEQITLPDTCEKIGYYAFGQCPSLEKIVIPRSVTVIDDAAFTRSDNVTIYCYTDSSAHQYAIERGIPFVLIDAAPTEPESYLLGDTDGNGDVDVVDATWIQRYSASMDVTPVIDTLMNGDVNDDGEPDVVDATFIMRYVVSIPTPYAIGEWIAYDS